MAFRMHFLDIFGGFTKQETSQCALDNRGVHKSLQMKQVAFRL